MNLFPSLVATCALGLALTSAEAAPVRVSFAGTISATNPGPLTAGAGFDGSFVLDDTVLPAGTLFVDAIDNFEFVSGGITLRGENGRLQLLQTTGTDFLVGSFNIGNASVAGSVPDGSEAYTLSNISFDFRLPGTAINDTVLPSGFELDDFSFVSLSFDFTHPTDTGIERTTILRANSFDTLNFTPVPLPATAWLLASAGGLVALRRRRVERDA